MHKKNNQKKIGGLRLKGIIKKRNKKLPLITIITVVLNNPKLLELTINSVIDQDYNNIEYIIIDGGSKDDTLEIIKQYEKRIDYWVSENDKGIYYAMNKGLDLANGDYVTFLNAGDYYTEKPILNKLFAENNYEDVVYGDIYVVENSENLPRYQGSKDFNMHELLSHGTAVVCHQAIFVKRVIAPKFNISYKYKAELNWYFDIIESNPDLKILYKKKAIVYYALGGYGYVKYKSNLYEWCRLVIKRFGLKTFVNYDYPGIMIRKLKYRYPKLNKYI